MAYTLGNKFFSNIVYSIYRDYWYNLQDMEFCPEASTRRGNFNVGFTTFSHPLCALKTHKQINIEPLGKGESVEYGTNQEII